MEKKTRPAGVTVAVSARVSVGVSLGLLLICAALLVRGAVGEGAAAALVPVCGAAASFVGGLLCVRRCPWGRMACGLVGAVAFGGVVACVAAVAWRDGALWLSSGVMVLSAIAAGGVLAGAVGRKRGKRVKRPVRRRL